jgi:hypothetical protein
MTWALALQQIEAGPKIIQSANSKLRTCTVCGKTKPIDEFYQYTTNSGAVLKRYKCTLCYRENKNRQARMRSANGKFRTKNSTTPAPSHTAAIDAAQKGKRRSGKTTPAPGVANACR